MDFKKKRENRGGGGKNSIVTKHATLDASDDTIVGCFLPPKSVIAST
jgi:hypothetical protein